MSACARDLARFGELLRNDGFYNGQQIVPADWVQQTRAAVITFVICLPILTMPA